MSVSTPSSNIHEASPTIAKSWKSSCACSMNCCRSGPGDRRQRAVLHGRGALAEPGEHRVDIEFVGHRRATLPGTAERARRATRGRPVEIGAHERLARSRRRRASATTASAWCGASSQTSDRRGRQPARRLARAMLAAPRARSGPRRARRAARSRATSGGRSASSCSATYGGFDTIDRQAAPELVRQRVEPRARAPMRTRVAAHPATFADATASASSLTSVAQTSTSGNSAFERERDRARAGTEVGDVRSGRAVERGTPRRPRVSPSRSASSSATSTTHSVSGRGISTRRSTIEVEAAERPRAEHVLQRLAARRGARTSSRSRASARAGASTSAASSHSAAS